MSLQLFPSQVMATFSQTMLFRTAVTRALPLATRSISMSTKLQAKVAVLGATGGIGQPLSLLW